MTGVSTPTGSGGVRDQEFEARIESVRVGVWLSLIVSVGTPVSRPYSETVESAVNHARAALHMG